MSNCNGIKGNEASVMHFCNANPTLPGITHVKPWSDIAESYYLTFKSIFVKFVRQNCLSYEIFLSLIHTNLGGNDNIWFIRNEYTRERKKYAEHCSRFQPFCHFLLCFCFCFCCYCLSRYCAFYYRCLGEFCAQFPVSPSRRLITRFGFDRAYGVRVSYVSDSHKTIWGITFF